MPDAQLAGTHRSAWWHVQNGFPPTASLPPPVPYVSHTAYVHALTAQPCQRSGGTAQKRWTHVQHMPCAVHPFAAPGKDQGHQHRVHQRSHHELECNDEVDAIAVRTGHQDRGVACAVWHHAWHQRGCSGLGTWVVSHRTPCFRHRITQLLSNRVSNLVQRHQPASRANHMPISGGCALP